MRYSCVSDAGDWTCLSWSLPVSSIPRTPKSLNNPIQMHRVFLRNSQRNHQNTYAKSNINASPNVGHYDIWQEDGLFIYGHVHHQVQPLRRKEVVN